MKLPIFAKLFIALLLSLAVMITAMIGTADWLFRQGFTEYLQQVEANRLGFLISNLETAYQQQGSWSFLQNNEREWRSFLAKLSGKEKSTPADNRPPPPDDNNFAPEEYPPPPEHGSFVPADHPPYNFPPPPRPPDALQLGKRLRLLNANHDYVVGAHFEEKPILRELKLDKKIIGWLEIQPNEIMTDELANTFLQQQKQAKARMIIFVSPALLSLDARSYRVSVGNQSISLSTIEFTLLSTLYQEPTRLFSRNQLMDSIYTDQRIVSDRTVDSHIKKLRKKLTILLPDYELIHAMYGAGYCYEARLKQG